MTRQVAARPCFAGFRWAVPQGFASALAACRFEQGDVLHAGEAGATGAWGESAGRVSHSLQVKSPARGPASKTEKELDSLFADNWTQPVTLELTHHASATTSPVATTQGRLYTLLWKGDLAVLDDAAPAPAPPTVARGLAKQLAGALDHVRAHAPRKFARGVVFLMPADPTSELLLAKHERLAQVLHDGMDATRVDVAPAEAGLAADAGFAPTLSIACWYVAGRTIERVETALKTALYRSTREKKSERESFKASAHGVLVEL